MKWLVSTALAVAAAVAVSAPASAGGWATTLIDPMPPIAAGKSYTVTFWILQHGSHVSMAPLSNPGLKLVPEAGEPAIFKGSPLPEGGRYSTVLLLPHEGSWQIYGMQSPFQDYKVGVLSIPGGLRLESTPAPLAGFSPDPSWIKAQPPIVNDQGQPKAVSVSVAPAVPKAAVKKAAGQPAAHHDSGAWPPAWPALVLLLALGTAGALTLGVYRRRNRGHKPSG